MTVGVIAMAYGTPASPEDVEAYYTHIRRGRPPTPELLANLRDRYDAIGGVSPLRENTEAQLARLRDALGERCIVELGQKHAPPFIEDAVASVATAGVERVVGVVLAPHYSRGSVGEYLDRLRETAAGGGLEARGIESWWDLDPWLDFQATAVKEALAELPARTTVLFTAHSLPERVLDGDPYPDQLRASAEAIAQRAGVERWDIAWQSAGRTPEPWRGPDIREVIAQLGGDPSTDGVLVCAQGFTADHLEVLYDLDVEAAADARGADLAFARTRMLNDDRDVFSALAERIRRT
ncbi:MAG: protoporphyrin/coproporphyrin ferrochelatase [Acidimicrobiaceae bacterium]